MNFEQTFAAANMALEPLSIETLQVNLGKLCNQACEHCHVDAGPKRTEMMNRPAIDRCLEILRLYPQIRNLDITGGAPELNDYFEYFVAEARALGRHVMVRHNLTVTLDPHPVSGKNMEHLPEFFRDHQCEVISSLPYYQEHETDAQRGQGVFAKSLESMRRLNALGYGTAGSGLLLDLVYNPVGAYLPPEQGAIEKQFKEELWKRHGILFNRLYVITNMPINRFRHFLERAELYESYMEKLMNAFNPIAAEGRRLFAPQIGLQRKGLLYLITLPSRLTGASRIVMQYSHFLGITARRIRFQVLQPEYRAGIHGYLRLHPRSKPWQQFRQVAS